MHCIIYVAMHKTMRYMLFPTEHISAQFKKRRQNPEFEDRKMSKTAKTTELPTFNAEKVTDQFRTFAEKGIEQSKEAYSKLKTGAETAQKALETSIEQARTVSNELSLKSIAAARTNTEAGFAHLEALFGAKSLSEVIELQSAFARKAVETAIEQAKDFQTASTKAAEDVSKPFKDVFEKGVKELKAA